jgi:hypothetical protein
MIVNLGDTDVEIKYISIEQYERIMDTPDMEDIDFIHLMTNLPVEDLKDAQYDQIKFVASYLKTWLNKLQNPPLDLEIVYEDERLGLIMPSEMSYGEYADLHTIISSQPLDVRLASAILYRPIIKGEGETRVIKKYDYDECKERARGMGKFPITSYMSALFFFTKFKQIQLETSPLFLETKRKTELKNPMKEPIEKN